MTHTIGVVKYGHQNQCHHAYCQEYFMVKLVNTAAVDLLNLVSKLIYQL